MKYHNLFVFSTNTYICKWKYIVCQVQKKDHNKKEKKKTYDKIMKGSDKPHI